MKVIDLIRANLERGCFPSLDDLGGLDALIAEREALVAQPFLDVLVHLAIEVDDPSAKAIDEIVLAGFRSTRHPVSFRDAATIVVENQSLRDRLAVPLSRVLFQRLERRVEVQDELVAAYAVETLLRLVLADTIYRHRLVAFLVEVDCSEDGLFIEHVPKLIGALYQRAPDDDLLKTLEKLLASQAAESEAAFELGLAWLGKALGHHDRETVLARLETAHHYFDRAFLASEERLDALAYRTTIEVIRGFARADTALNLAHSVELLERTVRSRSMWLDEDALPTWLRPRRDREIQWVRLAQLIRSAAKELNQASWLDAYRVMDQVLAVYDADTTVGVGNGLGALLRPPIETAFLKERGLMGHLNALLELNDWAPVNREVAVALRARISERIEEGVSAGKGLVAVNFPLLGSLIDNKPLVDTLPFEAAQKLEDALQSYKREQEWRGHPILQSLLEQIQEALRSCEEYTGQIKQDFDNLLYHIVVFCIDRLDASTKERGSRFDYLLRDDAKEGDLQSDLREYLQGNWPAAQVRTEVDGIGRGRSDLYIVLGAWRFIIELKKEERDGSKEGVQKYLGQAVTYQGTNVRLGLLGFLDLSRPGETPPHLRDNFWVETYVPREGESVRYAVVFRVPGNLPRPSEIKSTRVK